MRVRQTLPDLWLLSDQRNDARLEAALRRLPRRSGFVYRHYHLAAEDRRARFDALATAARRFDHLVLLSSACWNDVHEWGSDGLYGSYQAIAGVRPADVLWLAAAHDAAELAIANRHGADGVFLSPVFPTRSHPGAPTLGKAAFLGLAASSDAPVIALGGMDAEKAAELGWRRWGAIDGLS